MVNSVTFSAGVGGDGSTVTDDDNASTGLAAGGHRTRFVPALSQLVAVAGYVVNSIAAIIAQVDLAPAVTVVSAATTDIGAAASLRVDISGVVTITSFGTSTNKFRMVRFTGALLLTHNATTLILPGAANITTVAGDTAIATSDGSGNWRVRHYQRAADSLASTGSGAVVRATGASLTGAALNGTLGATTPAAATVTDLTATGNTTLGNSASDTATVNAKNISVPNKPLVVAYLAADTSSDKTGDGTEYSVLFDTELIDQGADFSGSAFTVPFPGNYRLGVLIRLIGVTTAYTTITVKIKCSVSGDIAYTTGPAPAANTEQSIAFEGVQILTGGELVYAEVMVSGSTKTIGIAGITLRSHLSVELIG